MKNPRAIFITIFSSLLVLAPLHVALPQPSSATRNVAPDMENVQRVVAVGDVHGDFETFVKLLQKSALVGSDHNWTGGEAVLVQTGDLLDRGADSRKVLDLVMKLEGQAEAAGGRVLILLGNHELFNLVGDLRYLHEKERTPYAADEDPRSRRRALKELEKFLKDPKPLLWSDYYRKYYKTVLSTGLEVAFPPGYFRHRKMLSPEGYYGKWLVAHTTIAKIDRTLFLHGGLSPRFGRLSFRDLRKQVRENLQEYFRIVDELVKLGVFHPMLGFIELYDLVSLESSTGRVDPKLVPLFRRFADVLEGAAFSSQGPLWYRGLAENSEGSFRAQVKRLLTRQQVDRIVIGHTHPAKYRITPRFGSTVYLIDTGMNQETYGGKPQALELGQARSPTVISLED